MSNEARTLDKLEIVGGALCLDFANTINSRHAPEHDYLATYPDLLAWSQKVGSLSAGQAKRLQSLIDGDSNAADATLTRAHRLRETIYQVFSALAAKRRPGEGDLKTLGESYSEAVRQARFVQGDDGYTLRWPDGDDVQRPLWPVAYSAGALLLSSELSRLKQCPGCGWLFLDLSKNQSRRWCSMNACGVRDKMRRYHRRR